MLRLSFRTYITALPHSLTRDKEARLQRSVNEYLLGLRNRVPRLVDWSEVQQRQLKADVTPPISDDAFDAERALLTAAVYAYLLEMTAIGAEAGEVIYSIPLGMSPLHDAVIEAAGTQTAKLVSGVTKTTRKYIQQAVQQSIAQGEDSLALVARIQKMVASPVRAEMIAQTESVNAYQAGLDIFGAESGVESWTWDALSGACRLCAPLHGVTKKIGRPFTLPNGKEVMRPAAHVNCRCGRIANYPN